MSTTETRRGQGFRIEPRRRFDRPGRSMTPPGVQLAPRPSETRCAYCHSAIDGPPVECPACHTRLHEDCVLQRCPTLGCRHGFAAAHAEPSPWLRGWCSAAGWLFAVVMP